MVVLDTLVAILASMIVLPAISAFGLDAGQGPSLTFVTLPFVFEKMAGGSFFMLTFFALLFLSALTSLISIYEPAVNLFMEKVNLSRTKATLATLAINLATALVVLASFTQKVDFGKDLFDLLDYITGTYTMSALMLVYCIFMGWKICPQLLKDLHSNGRTFKAYFSFALKWLAPAVFILLFLSA